MYSDHCLLLRLYFIVQQDCRLSTDKARFVNVENTYHQEDPILFMQQQFTICAFLHYFISFPNLSFLFATEPTVPTSDRHNQCGRNYITMVSFHHSLIESIKARSLLVYCVLIRYDSFAWSIYFYVFLPHDSGDTKI